MTERRRIGLREVRVLPINSEIWDTAVTRFGARRQRSDAVAYVLLYRTSEGRSRRFTIGRHGAPWTPDTARAEAKRLLGDVAKGSYPSVDKKARRTAITVAEFCDEYLEDAEAGRLLTRAKRPKKVSTLLSDKSRIEGHIKPLLGKLSVRAVTAQDIEAFMHSVAEGETVRKAKTARMRGLSIVRGGMGTASRAVDLLGAIFTYAVKRRMRTDNPVRGVVRPADGRRERRLSDNEYVALGSALRQARENNIWPAAVAAVDFLALTGWRSGEALSLRWEDLDLSRRTATLTDTKGWSATTMVCPISCNTRKVLSSPTGMEPLGRRSTRLEISLSKNSDATPISDN